MSETAEKRLNPIKTVVAVQRAIKRGTNLSINMTGKSSKELKKLLAFLEKNEIEYQSETKEYGEQMTVVAFSDFKKMWEFFGSKTGVPMRPLQAALSKKDGSLQPTSYTYEADGVETVFTRFYVLKKGDWNAAPTAFYFNNGNRQNP